MNFLAKFWEILPKKTIPTQLPTSTPKYHPVKYQSPQKAMFEKLIANPQDPKLRDTYLGTRSLGEFDIHPTFAKIVESEARRTIKQYDLIPHIGRENVPWDTVTEHLNLGGINTSEKIGLYGTPTYKYINAVLTKERPDPRTLRLESKVSTNGISSVSGDEQDFNPDSDTSALSFPARNAYKAVLPYLVAGAVVKDLENSLEFKLHTELVARLVMFTKTNFKDPLKILDSNHIKNIKLIAEHCEKEGISDEERTKLLNQHLTIPTNTLQTKLKQLSTPAATKPKDKITLSQPTTTSQTLVMPTVTPEQRLQEIFDKHFPEGNKIRNDLDWDKAAKWALTVGKDLTLIDKVIKDNKEINSIHDLITKIREERRYQLKVEAIQQMPEVTVSTPNKKQAVQIIVVQNKNNNFPYDDWYKSEIENQPLRENVVANLLERLEAGNGERKFLRDKVFEIKSHSDAGIRILYAQHGGNIILLGGCLKNDQSKAIEKAIETYNHFISNK